MMSREPQRVCQDVSSKTELVLDLVMPYLSTRDCVRTCILSSKWRYSWTTIPILLFDKSCCPLSFKGKTEAEGGSVLASIISRVLLVHSGSIQVLQIKDLFTTFVVPEIDCWLLRLSKYSIKTLVLELPYKYKLPSSLFTFRSLSSLELSKCSLRLPSSFNGFMSLKCLYLCRVRLTDDSLENLISSCPQLEKLTLRELNPFNRVDNLKISARNLQFLDIYCAFDNITFGYPLIGLLVFSVTLRGCCSSMYAESNLTEFFINLPNIQRFELDLNFIDYLSAGSIPESVSFQCKDLCYISISIDFRGLDMCLAALYIFRSSPNLAELEIALDELEEFEDSDIEDSGIWGDRSICCWEFKKLQRVKLNRFSGSDEELGFMKFVLENSPVLQKMTVVLGSSHIEWRDIKSIYGFKRASDEAKIIFDEHLIQKC